MAPAEGGALPRDLINDPHGKRLVQDGPGDTGTSSNPRCRTREEIEGHDAHHLKTCCTPYPATVNYLYGLEQDAGESLRHYIWRFRGVMDRIPPKQLYPDLVIVAFYSNVRSGKMRQKLSVHVVSTLEELWERADRCARYEEGRDLSPIEVV